MKERLTTYHCGKAVIKDKNKLSEAMEKLAEFEEKEKCGEWLDSIELAKIAIALQSQKWIPVSERLPEFKEVDVLGKPDVFKTEKVFIQTKRGEMFVAWCHKKVWLTKDFNDEYLWYTHGTGGRKMTVRSKVVAWMPLPEPFKEEEHEQTN